MEKKVKKENEGKEERGEKEREGGESSLDVLQRKQNHQNNTCEVNHHIYFRDFLKIYAIFERKKWVEKNLDEEKNNSDLLRIC